MTYLCGVLALVGIVLLQRSRAGKGTPRRRMIQGAARSAMAPMMSSMTAISTTPDMVGPLL